MSVRGVCLFLYTGIIALVIRQFNLFASYSSNSINKFFIDDNRPSAEEEESHNIIVAGINDHAGSARASAIAVSSSHTQQPLTNASMNAAATALNVDLQNEEPQRPAVFPPHLSKWLDDMDTSRPSPCGAFKCVFESKSYNDHYKSNDMTSANGQNVKFGYLVAQPTRYMRNKGKKIIRLQKSWENAQILSKNFGIHHFLLGPPQRLNCSETCASQLNNNTYATAIFRKRYSATNITTADDDVINATQLMVMPIHVAPSHFLFVGCKSEKKSAAWKQLNTYMNTTTTTPTTSDVRRAKKTSFDEFQYRLLSALNSTIRMLHSKEGRCLLRDFQVLLDPETGRIYNIDLDRCYQKKDDIKLKKCSKNLMKYSRTLLDWKQRHQ